MVYKIKKGQDTTEIKGSCKENAKKLHMRISTCIENHIFLYMTHAK